jgi:hypothetical protein
VGGVKKQFDKASGAASSGYLGASLRLMTADTRQGLTPEMKADFAAVAVHAKKHPDARRDAYLERVRGAAGVQPVISPPTRGM